MAVQEKQHRVQKTCPFCDEFISVKADICKHCLQKQVKRELIVVERDNYFILAHFGWIFIFGGVVFVYLSFLFGFTYMWEQINHLRFDNLVRLFVFYWVVQLLLSFFPQYDIRERHIPTLVDAVKRLKRTTRNVFIFAFFAPLILLVTLHYTAPKMSDFETYLEENTSYSTAQIIDKIDAKVFTCYKIEEERGVIIFFGAFNQFYTNGKFEQDL